MVEVRSQHLCFLLSTEPVQGHCSSGHCDILMMARELGVSVVIFVVVLLCASIQGTGAANFGILNQCPYTVWAAASLGGGKELQQNQSWTVIYPSGTIGRFWGRTGCFFDSNGRGFCKTGDCGGILNCEGNGELPATLVEFTVGGSASSDFYDISLVDGFNLPVSITPLNSHCAKVGCYSDINSKCPSELKVDGGCKSACTAFGTDQYCCTGSYGSSSACHSTLYSRFFKKQCPQTYTTPFDDSNCNLANCPVGTDYRIVFCP